MILLQQHIEDIRGEIENLRPQIPCVKYELDSVIESVKQIGQAYTKNFSIDNDNYLFFKQLILYFMGDPDFSGELKKGLFIKGNIGRGKTIALLIFRKICQHVLRHRCFRFVSSVDLVELFSKDGSTSFYRTGPLCIDDLGYEATEVSYYGNSVNVVESLLTARYNSFQTTGLITHVSSNYGIDYLEKLYGSRITSRMFEMFNVIEINGKDRRK